MNDIAVDLCKLLYAELAPQGLFPALTGGCLYKSGNRKDIDVVIYKHRENKDVIDIPSIINDIDGIKLVSSHGFVTKAIYRNRAIDILFPECGVDSNYAPDLDNEVGL